MTLTQWNKLKKGDNIARGGRVCRIQSVVECGDWTNPKPIKLRTKNDNAVVHTKMYEAYDLVRERVAE